MLMPLRVAIPLVVLALAMVGTMATGFVLEHRRWSDACARVAGAAWCVLVLAMVSLLLWPVHH